MITLAIDNSYSRITGLNPKEEKSLRNLLSYNTGSYFDGYGLRRKTLLTKKGEFPTGLLSKVILTFPKAVIKDNRIRPKEFNYKVCNFEPYDEQLLARRAAVKAERGIISMPTGSGKSLVIALIAGRLNVKTLVVVPSLEIRKQLSETILSALGPNHKVSVENIDSPALNKIKGFDCLIIDEAHHIAANTYHKLNKTMWKDIYYRFFLTATPFRNNTDEMMLFEAIAGQVIYQLDFKTAVSQGYIMPVEGYYIESPKQPTEAYTYAQVYKELVVNNTPKNFLICDLLTRLHSSGKSTLCLVKEVAHGKKLADITGLPFISGEDESSRSFIRQFNNGGITAVIATTGMLGEGIDTKPCEYVIIAGGGKAKSQFMQQVGRAVRKYEGKESAKIILIKDKSHKYLMRHFNAQKKILVDEYSTTMLELSL